MEIFSLKIEIEESVLTKSEKLKGKDVVINAWFGKMVCDFDGIPVKKETESILVKDCNYKNLLGCVFNKLIFEDLVLPETIYITNIQEAIYFNPNK